jgi:hypothetical protein
MGLGFVVVAILAACPTSPDKPECGADSILELDYPNLTAALTSSDLETSFGDGRRSFSWSKIAENVCSEEHANAQFTVNAAADRLPPGWRVEAGYLLTPLVGRTVTLVPGNVGENLRSYTGLTQIGLSQAFEGKPGRFLLFIDISFTSQGDVIDDRSVLQQALVNILGAASYKLHKD